GAVSRTHVIEAEWAEADVDHRLRRHRTHAGDRPGHHRTDLEVVRLHRDAELTRVLVTRDDRVGHLKPPIRSGARGVSRPASFRSTYPATRAASRPRRVCGPPSPRGR